MKILSKKLKFKVYDYMIYSEYQRVSEGQCVLNINKKSNYTEFQSFVTLFAKLLSPIWILTLSLHNLPKLRILHIMATCAINLYHIIIVQ